MQNLSCYIINEFHLHGPSPFFLRLASNAFPDIGSVVRIENKK